MQKTRERREEKEELARRVASLEMASVEVFFCLFVCLFVCLFLFVCLLASLEMASVEVFSMFLIMAL